MQFCGIAARTSRGGDLFSRHYNRNFQRFFANGVERSCASCSVKMI